MYINSYKYICYDNSELTNLVNNSFEKNQAIENIKNSLKRSAEEFETKQLLKKTKLVSSIHTSNLFYPTDTNEVSKIIDKEIEFLYAQKSSIKDDKFQKIVEELFPDELINKEMTIERETCDPVVLSSNFDQERHLPSPPSTDIISLAWSIAGLSYDNNFESEANESIISSDLTNDVSSSDRTREINQKIPETMKRSWENPEYRKIRAEAIKRSWEDEENRKKKKCELMKRNWQDPQVRQKRLEASKQACENPKFRKKRSEIMKRNWQDPEYREKRFEAIKRTCENLEYRKKMSESMKRTLEAHPEYKKKRSESMKRNWQDPEFRKKRLEALQRRHLYLRNQRKHTKTQKS